MGAGPAGSSLAIRLAQTGFETTLIERERFPRQKLCGEFISPECFAHFEELGCLDSMLDAGGDRIFTTHFFALGGREIEVPTGWFSSGEAALSLSRAEMDARLVRRAREAGVEVHEGVTATGVEWESDRMTRLVARNAGGQAAHFSADLFIDASGRKRALAKLAEGRNTQRFKPRYVSFKAHLTGTAIPKGACEIYSVPGGYAGISNIEGGLANLCFLLTAKKLRSSGNDPAEIVEKVVKKNPRAAQVLRHAAATDKWMAVSIEGFGSRAPAPASNIISIGDAASFIDPFTGSGMLMAFESARLLAVTLAKNPAAVAACEYQALYQRKFVDRLRLCSLLRRSAFIPAAATAAVTLLSASSSVRRAVARRTRQ